MKPPSRFFNMPQFHQFPLKVNFVMLLWEYLSISMCMRGPLFSMKAVRQGKGCRKEIWDQYRRISSQKHKTTKSQKDEIFHFHEYFLLLCRISATCILCYLWESVLHCRMSKEVTYSWRNRRNSHGRTMFWGSSLGAGRELASHEVWLREFLYQLHPHTTCTKNRFFQFIRTYLTEPTTYQPNIQ